MSDSRQRNACVPERVVSMSNMNGASDARQPEQRDVIDPAILYFGTPVALISSTDDHGRANLAPISSIFWLGRTAVLGIGALSATARNLRVSRQCVINLPSVHQVAAVDRLAFTTGLQAVPPRKYAMGYRYQPDKFRHALLTPANSATVAPPYVAECPVAMEAKIMASMPLGVGRAPAQRDGVAFEARITRVHVHPSIRLAGFANRIDPAKWRPIIMSFQKYFGLGHEVHPSRLATIDEAWYR